MKNVIQMALKTAIFSKKFQKIAQRLGALPLGPHSLLRLGALPPGPRL